MNLSTVQFICTFIVGSIFLVTAIIKAIDARQFIRHNLRYDLAKPKLIKLASITFITIESGLGLALIFQIYLLWLIPFCIVLLLCLSGLTIWSTSSGHTLDCGCYGGMIIVTPKQSILLNLGYILLLMGGLDLGLNNPHEDWQGILILIVSLTTGILALRSRNSPLVDFSRLKPGKKWQSAWLRHSELDLQHGKYFVAFISSTCKYCHRWIGILNQVHSQSQAPQILGIISLQPQELESFKASNDVLFPLATMDRLLFSYMIEGVPTGVLIENGVIISIWNGNLPPQLLSLASDNREVRAYS